MDVLIGVVIGLGAVGSFILGMVVAFNRESDEVVPLGAFPEAAPYPGAYLCWVSCGDGSLRIDPYFVEDLESVVSAVNQIMPEETENEFTVSRKLD